MLVDDNDNLKQLLNRLFKVKEEIIPVMETAIRDCGYTMFWKRKTVNGITCWVSKEFEDTDVTKVVVSSSKVEIYLGNNKSVEILNNSLFELLEFHDLESTVESLEEFKSVMEYDNNVYKERAYLGR